MKRFIKPVVEYFVDNYFYVLVGGYEKEWTKKELVYVNVGELMSSKIKSK